MNLKACEIITKLNQESQNKKLRLFAKVDFEIKLKILTFQKQLFHKLKNNNSDVDNNQLNDKEAEEIYEKINFMLEMHEAEHLDNEN